MDNIPQLSSKMLWALEESCLHHIAPDYPSSSSLFVCLFKGGGICKYTYRKKEIPNKWC